jgi:hypothetical protein
VHYYFNPAGGTIVQIVQEDFWNFLGKNTQTFNSLIKLFESYGKTNKKKIWDGFSKLIDINNGINSNTNSASRNRFTKQFA